MGTFNERMKDILLLRYPKISQKYEVRVYVGNELIHEEIVFPERHVWGGQDGHKFHIECHIPRWITRGVRPVETHITNGNGLYIASTEIDLTDASSITHNIKWNVDHGRSRVAQW